MSTRTLVTAEELWAMPDDGLRHELIEGEVTTTTLASTGHGRVAATVLVLIANFVRQHGLGTVYAAGTGFWIGTDPDTVRAPDVAFVSKERVPEVTAARGFGRGAPDLVVEVVSPDDSYVEVQLQVQQWLTAGARLGWVVHPKTRTVAVHAPRAAVVTRRRGEGLDGGDVLPGFSCPVAEVFG